MAEQEVKKKQTQLRAAIDRKLQGAMIADMVKRQNRRIIMKQIQRQQQWRMIAFLKTFSQNLYPQRVKKKCNMYLSVTWAIAKLKVRKKIVEIEIDTKIDTGVMNNLLPQAVEGHTTQ